MVGWVSRTACFAHTRIPCAPRPRADITTALRSRGALRRRGRSFAGWLLLILRQLTHTLRIASRALYFLHTKQTERRGQLLCVYACVCFCMYWKENIAVGASGGSSARAQSNQFPHLTPHPPRQYRLRHGRTAAATHRASRGNGGVLNDRTRADDRRPARRRRGEATYLLPGPRCLLVIPLRPAPPHSASTQGMPHGAGHARRCP